MMLSGQVRRLWSSRATRRLNTQVCLALLCGLAFAGLAALPVRSSSKTLLVSPYVQLGEQDTQDSLSILWAVSSEDDEKWNLQFQSSKSKKWQDALVAKPGLVPNMGKPLKLYRAVISGLLPGEKFQYQLLKNGDSVFSAAAQNRKPGPHSFAVFGDCGADSLGQRALAAKLYDAKPDLVMITGDIVYDFGRTSEYLRHFFPVYNTDAKPDPKTGAPLLRSVLFTAAPGNHDIWRGVSDNTLLSRYPDGLAYFEFWAQPLNGPQSTGRPPLKADTPVAQNFAQAASPRYPRMASFSFDYGNAHWTVLDSNEYMDWLKPSNRDWLEADLKSAQKAQWRFVSFHHPAFHSGHDHADDQQMRKAVDLFERYKVDVVFAGHVHNYQRSFPLRFKLTPQPDGNASAPDGSVKGEFVLDKTFDGVKDTTPDGPLYIVSGGGGARLYGELEAPFQQAWHPFTNKFIAAHSITLCDLKNDRLSVRQIGIDGKEIDRFDITKRLAGQ